MTRTYLGYEVRLSDGSCTYKKPLHVGTTHAIEKGIIDIDEDGFLKFNSIERVKCSREVFRQLQISLNYHSNITESEILDLMEE